VKTKAAYAFALLVLLCPLVAADSLADELADFGLALDAEINIDNAPLLSSPQIISVVIAANNPYNSSMPIYALRQSEAGWEVVKLIGALPPNSESTIELEVEVEYEKERKKTTRYAVVGRGGDGQLYGRNFYVVEDWEAYESEIRDTLSISVVTVVPIVAVLLIILLIAMAQIAYTSKSPGEEYTLKSLVFPAVEGKPFEEKVADIMIHPLMMAFEVACVIVLVFVLFDSLSQSSGFDDGLKILALSAVGSFAVPFLYFAAAWYFEKREEGKPLRFFAGIFVWGMFAAFLSLLISSGIVSELKGFEFAPYALIATMLIAPVVEETIKGFGILFMSGHHEYNDTLTGLLLGFTCGVGFAFVENLFYFSSKTNPFEIGLVSWGALILYRSFFNTLAHGCFTAAVSTAIGYARSVDRLKKFARIAFAPGVFLAIVIHSIFNMSALADNFVIASRQVPFFIFNPMLIILLAAMFFLVLVLATIDEKKRKVAAKGAKTGLHMRPNP